MDTRSRSMIPNAFFFTIASTVAISFVAWGMPAFADVTAGDEVGHRLAEVSPSASDVGAILEEVKDRRYGEEAAAEWMRKAEAGDLDAHVRLICWQYWHMMRIRSHERDMEKWGGFRKTRDESQAAADQLRETTIKFFRMHPQSIPPMAEVMGDGMFWTPGQDLGFAVIMYHTAFREDQIASSKEELTKRMAYTFDLMARNAVVYPDTPGGGLPINLFPMPLDGDKTRYIAAWRAADVLLKEGGWKALREAEDPNVQDMVKYLDHLADSRGAAWGWIDPAATQPKQPEPPPDWVTQPRNDPRLHQPQ